MEQSSFQDEQTVRHQFDSLCKLALKSEVINYEKHMAYRQKYEVMLSELSEKELSRLFIMDEHEMETHRFQVLGYDIEVKDALIAEALQTLTEKKRNVVLLSYFMDMSDADIAREMNLVRSTINEHRRRSLELMRKNKEQKNTFDLLPFHIIEAASTGDTEAIQVVLKHYEGYITILSTRKMFDEFGQVHYCVDETLRQRLETKLITKTLGFDPKPYTRKSNQ